MAAGYFGRRAVTRPDPMRSPRTPRCGSAARRTGWSWRGRPRDRRGGARRGRRGRAAAAARRRLERRDRGRGRAAASRCWCAVRAHRRAAARRRRAASPWRRARTGTPSSRRRSDAGSAGWSACPASRAAPAPPRCRTWAPTGSRSRTCSSTSTSTTGAPGELRPHVPAAELGLGLPRERAQAPRRRRGAARPVPAAPGRHERPDPLPRAGPRARRAARTRPCAAAAAREAVLDLRRGKGMVLDAAGPRHVERRVVLHQPGAARRRTSRTCRVSRAGPSAPTG